MCGGSFAWLVVWLVGVAAASCCCLTPCCAVRPTSFGLGLLGAAVAWDAVQATSLALMVLCCWVHTRRQLPHRWARACVLC